MKTTHYPQIRPEGQKTPRPMSQGSDSKQYRARSSISYATDVWLQKAAVMMLYTYRMCDYGSLKENGPQREWHY